MGVKFTARCTLECIEHLEGIPQALCTKSCDRLDDLFPWPSNSLPGRAARDISFELVEGDFKVGGFGWLAGWQGSLRFKAQERAAGHVHECVRNLGAASTSTMLPMHIPDLNNGGCQSHHHRGAVWREAFAAHPRPPFLAPALANRARLRAPGGACRASISCLARLLTLSPPLTLHTDLQGRVAHAARHGRRAQHTPCIRAVRAAAEVAASGPDTEPHQQGGGQQPGGCARTQRTPAQQWLQQRGLCTVTWPCLGACGPVVLTALRGQGSKAGRSMGHAALLAAQHLPLLMRPVNEARGHSAFVQTVNFGSAEAASSAVCWPKWPHDL